MFLILLLFLLIAYPKFKIVDFNDEFISKNTTTMINGIFVLLVFMGHFRQYVDLNYIIDKPYIMIHSGMDQLIVTTFLFFSGYGMYESYKRKGKSYVESVTGRIVKLLIRFFIAVTCFLIMNMFLHIEYEWKHILFSYVGWESIGNSNWYIFVILVLYILFYFAFISDKYNDFLKIGILTFLMFLFVIFLKISGKPVFWYNTILCFLAGMVFSFYKDKIVILYKRNNRMWILSIVCLSIVFLFTAIFRNKLICYEIMSISFVCIILLILMKVKVSSSFFTFLGKHVFSIYILQRIPMICISTLQIELHPYLFFATSFIITIVFAIIFDKMMEKLKL